MVEALGVDHTLRLIEEKGGTAPWIPKGVDNTSEKLRAEFELEFGKPMTQALIRAFGGGAIKVPLAANWRTQIYHAQGMTMDQIARKLGCASDTVHRRLNRKVRRSNSRTAADLTFFQQSARAATTKLKESA